MRSDSRRGRLFAQPQNGFSTRSTSSIKIRLSRIRRFRLGSSGRGVGFAELTEGGALLLRLVAQRDGFLLSCELGRVQLEIRGVTLEIGQLRFGVLLALGIPADAAGFERVAAEQLLLKADQLRHERAIRPDHRAALRRVLVRGAQRHALVLHQVREHDRGGARHAHAAAMQKSDGMQVRILMALTSERARCLSSLCIQIQQHEANLCGAPFLVNESECAFEMR